ncbi:MAG: hypothetical protein QUU85_07635 [Candidatus Eisenbacteria bacterium]|nr:hypothetical protein [Candidatus Eisenbacteria bacterium]
MKGCILVTRGRAVLGLVRPLPPIPALATLGALGALLLLALGLLSVPARAGSPPAARVSLLPFSEEGEECTIAVASGLATADGRPILWKNRDTGYQDNEAVYFDDGLYRYVTLVNAGQTDEAWIGVNERGFAIANALSHNLPDSLYIGITNGELMKRALQICGTVEDFEGYLKTTNKLGRQNPANFAVLDAAGGAAMFEAGNRHYLRYDAAVAPRGVLVRTNFSFWADTTGYETWRFRRCSQLVGQAIQMHRLMVRTFLQEIARDIRPADLDPYPLPFEGTPPEDPKAHGYVCTANTINRRNTVAGGAVLGVRAGEDPMLSAFFAALGQPVSTIPLPVWVAAGATPPEMDGALTSPVCDEAKERMERIYDYLPNFTLLNTYELRSPSRGCYLAQAERVERWIFDQADLELNRWRREGATPEEMRQAEQWIAQRAFRAWQKGEPLPGEVRLDLYAYASPNPSRGATILRIESERALPAGLALELLDVQGRRVVRLPAGPETADHSPGGQAWPANARSVLWDGRDASGRRVSAGIYFYRPVLANGEASASAPAGSVVLVP